jgi:hypothetical protein
MLSSSFAGFFTHQGLFADPSFGDHFLCNFLVMRAADTGDLQTIIKNLSKENIQQMKVASHCAMLNAGWQSHCLGMTIPSLNSMAELTTRIYTQIVHSAHP